MKKQIIKLEPHNHYKKAIVKKDKNGLFVYNYYKLIDVCMNLNNFDYETAQEFVDYNIVSLSPNGFKISYSIKAYI
jgi:hypothetical protein